MSRLTNAERETHFNIVADNRSVCHIFTDDPVWIRKLERWFIADEEVGEGKSFTVPTSLVIRTHALTEGTDKLRAYTDVDSEGL